MRLLSLNLKNFRQFLGENVIDFGKDNKVTVIYGLNGYGKTGIFRAIIFCLYGQAYLERDNLDSKSKNKGLILVNEDLVEEGNGDYKEASVTLKFEHGNNIYELTRTVLCAKQGEEYNQEKGSVKLVQIKDGNTKPAIEDHDEIKHIINSIIDEKNKDFFLFDGEQMEELTKQSSESRKNIQRGITNLLKLDAINAVKLSIKRNIKDVNSEISDNSLEVELEKINEKINKNREKLDDTEGYLATYEDELEGLHKDKKEIADKLRSSKDGAEKQKRKDDFLREIEILENEIVEVDSQIKDKFSIMPAFLGESIISDAYIELQNRVDKGELPGNIREDFIKELINRGKCICGNKLHDNADAIALLKEYLDKNINKYAEAGSKVYQIVSGLNSILKYENEKIENIAIVYNTKTQEKSSLDMKIQDINEELEGLINTRDYAEKDKMIDREIISYKAKIEVAYRDIDNFESEYKNLIDERKKYTDQDEKLKSLQSKLNLLEQSSSELNRVYQEYSDDLRAVLSECATKIMTGIADNETLKSIHKLSITDKFNLDVLNKSGMNILSQISSGQRQIVSISYICSLMQVAIGLQMPLLMDTPFGRLSGIPRDACLKQLPSLLSQWILLTTDTEFTTEEANALSSSNSWNKIYEIEKKDGYSKLVEKDIKHWKPKRSTI